MSLRQTVQSTKSHFSGLLPNSAYFQMSHNFPVIIKLLRASLKSRTIEKWEGAKYDLKVGIWDGIPADILVINDISVSKVLNVVTCSGKACTPKNPVPSPGEEQTEGTDKDTLPELQGGETIPGRETLSSLPDNYLVVKFQNWFQVQS